MPQLFKCDMKVEGLDEIKQMFSSDLIRKAIRSSLDRSGTFGKKALVEALTDEFNVQPSKVRDAIDVQRTTQTENEIRIRVKGRAQSLYHDFGARQTPGGVLANVKKGSLTFIPHAFIRTGIKSGWTGVLIRVGKGRYPLTWKVNREPSIAGWVKGHIWDLVEKKILDFFQSEFKNQIEKRSTANF